MLISRAEYRDCNMCLVWKLSCLVCTMAWRHIRINLWSRNPDSLIFFCRSCLCHHLSLTLWLCVGVHMCQLLSLYFWGGFVTFVTAQPSWKLSLIVSKPPQKCVPCSGNHIIFWMVRKKMQGQKFLVHIISLPRWRCHLMRLVTLWQEQIEWILTHRGVLVQQIISELKEKKCDGQKYLWMLWNMLTTLYLKANFIQVSSVLYAILCFSDNKQFLVVFMQLLSFWLSYTLPYVSSKKNGRMTFFFGGG